MLLLIQFSTESALCVCVRACVNKREEVCVCVCVQWVHADFICLCCRRAEERMHVRISPSVMTRTG